MAQDYSKTKINAWRRENGRVGVRNHVLILPVDDISNAACEAVANNVKGTLVIPHAYGRLQFGEDLDLHFRTIIGTGANPNVAAVVVPVLFIVIIIAAVSAVFIYRRYKGTNNAKIQNMRMFRMNLRLHN